MRRHRRGTVLVASLAALALLAAACGSDDDGAATTTTAEDGTETTIDDSGDPGEATTTTAAEVSEGGEIVLGAEQELLNFNVSVGADQLFWGQLITQLIWPSGLIQTPDYEVIPQVFDGEPLVVSEDPLVVEWRILDEAVWSDGTPVSTADLEYYLLSCNGRVDPGEPVTEVDGEEVTGIDCVNTAGYELITDFEIVDDKMALGTFSEVFAEYDSLFSNPLVPAHIAAERGEDAWNSGFVDDPGVSAGPYQLKEWVRGQYLTMERNPEYWGEPAGLDEITFQFITDSNALPQALQNGEVQIIYPQPQLDLVEIVEGIPGVVSETNFGPVFEHLTFNTRGFLGDEALRQAVALAVDREGIVEVLMAPFSPEAEVLNNRVYMTNQEQYQDNAGEFANQDIAAARALIEGAGWTEGADGIYERDGERLQLRIITTGGNALREDTQELVQAQLAEAGIDLIINNRPGGEAFDVMFDPSQSAEWDIALFAWVGTVWPAASQPQIYGTGSGGQPGDFSSPEADELMAQANATIDPDERAALLNELDVLLWQLMPSVPLYQKPTFIAYYEDYANIVDNTTSQGPTWNAQEWTLTG